MTADDIWKDIQAVFLYAKILLRGGLEMVPAGPHKSCNVGSNPTPATHRDVAQVVARVIWDHEAAGSSPVIPI